MVGKEYRHGGGAVGVEEAMAVEAAEAWRFWIIF